MARRSELDHLLDDAAARIAAARHVVALTGAGLSVESGIPPFRGPGGLWTKHGEPPLNGWQEFLRDPRAAWEARLNPRGPMRELWETLQRAQPNPGHHALAALERMGVLRCLITQNVDDLHRQAGSKALLEIHGNHALLRCLACHTRFEPAAIPVDEASLPPLCPDCGGVIKGDTVQFGEPIPPDVLRGCYRAVERCDCMLVVGTTATVYPAAEFPFEVLRRGGPVIEVNPHESELTHAATLSLAGPGGAVLPRLVDHVARRSAGERR